ncbi:NUDIX domain-containing protein, partial [Candidatus Uhrbacteria bacterium]|nr:NUDIX domain-containing protein [Candidatus Uhrbacteria bacterium]
ETHIFAGRRIHLEWHESDTYPNDIPVSQVTGFCVNERGDILLVKNRRGWGFPGGHPEGGETVLETLKREVSEESNAEIEPIGLVGYVEVNDPENEGIEGKHYVQLRYLAKVTGLREWEGAFETSERIFAPLEDVSKYVPWITSSPVGRGQVESLGRSVGGNPSQISI